MINTRQIWTQMEEYWERCCARYPQIIAQAGRNVTPYFDTKLWVGVPMPDLEGGPPFRLSFEAFLGGKPRRMSLSEGRLTGLYPIARIVEEDVAVWREYAIGRVVYSSDPEAHRRVERKYGLGWAAKHAGEIVGCDRIDWTWVHPKHRGKGLGTRIEVEKWTTVPHYAFYMRYAFQRNYTPDGMALQEKLYKELIRRGLIVGR